MDAFIGDIFLFPYGFTPQDWCICDGRQLQVNSNQALFSLIGNKYGGDGRVNFNLPNLKGAEPIPGMNYYIAIRGIYPQRS